LEIPSSNQTRQIKISDMQVYGCENHRNGGVSSHVSLLHGRHCFGQTTISALHVVAANMAALKKAASAVVPRATKVERCGMPEIMALLSKRFAS